MNFNDLEKYISADRLATYSTLLGCNDLDKAVGAYCWNKALGGAVYTFFQCLEVSLRNSLHIEARTKFNRETWYEYVCNTAGSNVRRKQARNGRQTTQTENEVKIKNAIDKLRKQRKIVSSANVISTLMLGFWVNLFKNDYSSSNQSLLWPELLPKVFPNAPRSKQLSSYYDDLKEINLLRNRFSHHEPLWKSGVISTIDDAINFLDTQITKIVEYVGYINMNRAEMLKKSAAYKEFKGLNRRECFDIFVGNSKNMISTQQFKSDLNLYMKRACDNHQIIFVKRNGYSVAKLTSYL